MGDILNHLATDTYALLGCGRPSGLLDMAVVPERKWTLVHRALLMRSSRNRHWRTHEPRGEVRGLPDTSWGGLHAPPHHLTLPSSHSGLLFGRFCNGAYARISSGMPTVLLDLPVIPPEEQTHSIARRLMEIGPLRIAGTGSKKPPSTGSVYPCHARKALIYQLPWWAILVPPQEPWLSRWYI